MPSAYLPDRRLISISGEGAQEFLQNLITTDIESLPENVARPGALLTPQGKILFDFLIWRDAKGYVIETDALQQETLVRRLTMYKLRALVDIRQEQAQGVSVFWSDPDAADGVQDSRFEKAGVELWRKPDQSSDGGKQAYDALRIEFGIAVSGDDYALQDAFPHDVLMDVNDGVSFRKGCFVGQEVVSRMKHRGTARRRVVLVSSEVPLPVAGTDLTAGGKVIGTLGSVSGSNGLAIIRTDRAASAMASSTDILAGDVVITVSLPTWSGLEFPAVDTAAVSED